MSLHDSFKTIQSRPFQQFSPDPAISILMNFQSIIIFESTDRRIKYYRCQRIGSHFFINPTRTPPVLYQRNYIFNRLLRRRACTLLLPDELCISHAEPRNCPYRYIHPRRATLLLYKRLPGQ